MRNIFNFFKNKNSYAISFIIVFFLTIIGFLINYTSVKHSTYTFSWPINFFLLLFFIASIANLHFYFQKKSFRWIYSIPASISAIVTFSLLVFLMGLIPQSNIPDDSFFFKTGLSNIVNSWSFFLISIYLLTILGFVTLNRVRKINFRNFVFLLNHLGLWITIATASLGSGDVLKFQMTTREGQKTKIVQNNLLERFEMPFEVELVDFNIDEYTPQLAFVNPMSNQLLHSKKEKLIDIKGNNFVSFRNWNITIKKYIENSVPSDSGSYVEKNMPGSVPAVLIEVKSKDSKITKNGWVTCGSPFIPQKILYIDSENAIAMSVPAPKRFSSIIKIHTKDQISSELKVEVNKPISVGKWKLYQIGYDDSMGKWSKVSTFEIVKDPWINGVYLGIGMLLVGSLLLFWVGKNKDS